MMLVLWFIPLSRRRTLVTQKEKRHYFPAHCNPFCVYIFSTDAYSYDLGHKMEVATGVKQSDKCTDLPPLEEIEVKVETVDPIVNPGRSFLPVAVTTGIELMAAYLHNNPESFTGTTMFESLKNFQGFNQSWVEGNKHDALEHLFLAYAFDEKGVSVFIDTVQQASLENEISARLVREVDNFKLKMLQFWVTRSSESSVNLFQSKMALLDEVISMAEVANPCSLEYRLRPSFAYHKACQCMFRDLPEQGLLHFTSALQMLETDENVSMWPYMTTGEDRLLALFQHNMILEARLNVGRALSGLRSDSEKPEQVAIEYITDFVHGAQEDSHLYDVALCDLFLANVYLDMIQKSGNPGESSLSLIERAKAISTRRIPIYNQGIIEHPAFTIAAEVAKFSVARTYLKERNAIEKKKNNKTEIMRSSTNVDEAAS